MADSDSAPPAISPEQRAMLADMAKEVYDNKDSKNISQNMQEMWAAMDTDGDGAVTLHQALRFFHTSVSNSSGPEDADEYVAMLERNWGLIDSNGDGTLDKYELGALMLLENAAMCDCCMSVILDPKVWACASCWTKALTLSSEELESDDPEQGGDLVATFCTRCRPAGGAHATCAHGHAMQLVDNEWRTPFQQWAFSKGLVDVAAEAGSA